MPVRRGTIRWSGSGIGATSNADPSAWTPSSPSRPTAVWPRVTWPPPCRSSCRSPRKRRVAARIRRSTTRALCLLLKDMSNLFNWHKVTTFIKFPEITNVESKLYQFECIREHSQECMPFPGLYRPRPLACDIHLLICCWTLAYSKRHFKKMVISLKRN